jgi:hypothetical protein
MAYLEARAFERSLPMSSSSFCGFEIHCFAILAALSLSNNSVFTPGVYTKDVHLYVGSKGIQ